MWREIQEFEGCDWVVRYDHVAARSLEGSRNLRVSILYSEIFKDTFRRHSLQSRVRIARCMAVCPVQLESAMEKKFTIEDSLKKLIGFQLFKSWNIFGTRMFYFAAPNSKPSDDGDYRLTLECPWRIEAGNRILVGSEDYGIRADDNSDPNWNRVEDQWGHRQDQKLEAILGEMTNGVIHNRGAAFVVEHAMADSLGGFQLHLSGGYLLAVFPTSEADMEWLLSDRNGGYLSLMNGKLSDRSKGS